MSLSKMLNAQEPQTEIISRLRLLSKNCPDCKERMNKTLKQYKLTRVTATFWAATCMAHQPWVRGIMDVGEPPLGGTGYIHGILQRIQDLQDQYAALGRVQIIHQRMAAGAEKLREGNIARADYDRAIETLEARIEAKHRKLDASSLQRELGVINNALIEYQKELAETNFTPPKDWK